MPVTLGMLIPKHSSAPSIVRLQANATGNATTSGNNTTFKYSNVSFGAATPTRCVVAYISGFSSSGSVRTVVSVTIGGVAATVLHQATHLTSGNPWLTAIAIARVPTGTSGLVVVTYSAAMNQNRVVCSSFDNVQSFAPISAGDANMAGQKTVTVPNIIFPAGGLVTGFCASQNSRTHTWVNATEVRDFVLSSFALSTADEMPTSRSTLPVSVTASTATFPNGVLVVVSIR